MSAEGRLFEVPAVESDAPAPQESATVRLTKRNNELLAAGVHPATHRPTVQHALDTRTCGDCPHARHYQWHNGWYWKCSLHRLGESHSAASDIRKSWPACTLIDAAPSDPQEQP